MKIGDQPVNANSVENLYGAKGDSDSWERASLGITLRQHYAGLAMQAMLSNPNVIGFSPMCGWNLVNCDQQQLSEFCAHSADMLLAELEKQNES